MAIPAPAELVEAAAVRVGGRKRLAQLLDVETAQLSKWAGATSAPSYEYAMRMVEIAGWLSRNGEDEQVPVTRIEPPDSRLESLAEQAAALTEGQDRAMLVLEGLMSRLETHGELLQEIHDALRASDAATQARPKS